MRDTLAPEITGPDPRLAGPIRGRLTGLRAAVAASTVVVVLAVVVGLGLWWLSLGAIHAYRSGPAGLIAELPPLWWLSLAIVAASFVGAVTRLKLSTFAVAFSLSGLVVILAATAQAAESAPRFSVAYVTAGFSEYIGRTGHILPDFDARFYWPGLFAALGMAARAMDVPTTWFIRWAPVVFNFAYLLPVKAIANGILRSERARWTALGLFVVGNWVGQDYLSPQAVGLFLYLTILAVVIRVFRSPRAAVVSAPLMSRLRRAASFLGRVFLRLPDDLARRDGPPVVTSGAARVALLAALLVLVAASVVSHQLTPVALGLAMAFLVLARSTTLRTLWLLVVVLVVAWLCWVAEPYWVGHLSAIFGGVGHPTGNLTSNVSAHLDSAVPASHKLVLDARTLAAGLVAITAVWALWCGLRRGNTNSTMVALLVAPIVLLGGQSYGGEAILRVFLFSLAPACILVAGLLELVPLRDVRWKATRLLGPVAVALLGFILLASFPLTRWGNESFEAITPTDVQATDWVILHVPKGSTVTLGGGVSSIVYSHIENFHYGDLTPLLALRGAALVAAIRKLGPNPWILIDRYENEFGIVNDGYPPAWLSDLKRSLLATGQVVERYGNATAAVLQVLPPAVPRPRPIPSPQHIVGGEGPGVVVPPPVIGPPSAPPPVIGPPSVPPPDHLVGGEGRGVPASGAGA